MIIKLVCLAVLVIEIAFIRYLSVPHYKLKVKEYKLFDWSPTVWPPIESEWVWGDLDDLIKTYESHRGPGSVTLEKIEYWFWIGPRKK